jgi:GT2 family glycosyltransferase
MTSLSRNPLLSVVVVNFNTAHLLASMFDAIKIATQDINHEVIVIDNASVDDSPTVLAANYPSITLLRNSKNMGFGRANNQALPLIKGDYVLLLNTDAFMAPDSIQRTIELMRNNEEIGIVGVRLLGRDGSLQPSCRYFPTPYNVFLSRTGLSAYLPRVEMVDDLNWDHTGVRECDWVPGCFYMIRRTALDQVGLFDPRFFLYCEEVDHCKRMKQHGWKVVYLGCTSCVHYGGESAASIGKLTQSGRQISTLQLESELLYFRKHYGRTGLLLHLLLSVAGDAILATKALLRTRRLGLMLALFDNSLTTIKFAKRTHWGVQPTR